MTTLEKIKNLCKKHGVTVQKLELDLGEKPTSIAKITSNSKGEKLLKIARYFGVTVEYLIDEDRKEPDNFDISEFEYQIILKYRELSERQQALILSDLHLDLDSASSSILKEA